MNWSTSKREMRLAKRRQKAAQALTAAVKNWDLPPARYLICFDCDSQAQCYDHRDYSKPLDVWPVCFKCDARRGAARPYDGRDPNWERRRIATEKRLGICRQRVYQLLK